MRDDVTMDQIAGQDAERLLLGAERAGGEASADVLAGLVGGDGHYARELVGQLVQLGLAHPSSYDGELTLSSRGRRLAARVIASLEAGWRRDDLTRRWVLETARSGERTSAPNLHRSWGLERDRSIKEIERAIKVLANYGLIDVLNAMQGQIVMGIEQEGRDALERALILRPSGVPATVVNDYSRTLNQHGGSIGGVQLGDNSTQHNTLTLGSEAADVRAAFERALDHVDELPSHIAETVRVVINDAIAETNAPQPRAGFIRELAQKVVLAVATAAGTSAGGAIFAEIGPLAG